MDDEPTGGADEEAPGPAVEGQADAPAAGTDGGDGSSPAAGEDERGPAVDIAALPWDDDLPLALGEDDDLEGGGPTSGDDDELDAGDYEYDDVGGRRNALPRRVESWRARSATGAIATAVALGLQQVFEPEKRRPAAVAEAPSDPYSDDDPVTVDYLPDDAEGTTVHVKPWLLQKGDPA